MGTRAVITFIDADNSRYSVYQHWDGDPGTVLKQIRQTSKRWPWPRYEADEYAAAYIATHKTDPGNIRISRGPSAHGDIAYRYEVRFYNTDKLGRNDLQVITKNGSNGKKIGTDYITPEE